MNAPLRRSLSLPLVALYGLGNILGAGIYVLIGKVAGEAAYFAPLAFLLAALIAAITAFSFSELCSRYPLSAGEAVYVQEGFGIPRLSLVVGLLIIMTGIVSAATITRGFLGYLGVFLEAPDFIVICLLLAVLGLIAIWGIAESVRAAAFFTLLEIGGLLLILAVTAPAFEQIPDKAAQFIPDLHIGTWTGILSGSFLAFYAYIGFEDMVNVAEEVKQPQKNLPIAIMLALSLATIFYILIAVSALLLVSPAELSQSDAPLALVYETATGRSPWLISVVSLFAVINGALIQIIMASRVCYGLARQGWLPESLGSVHPRTRTPIIATVLITAAIIITALWLPIETLANTTTYLLLIIFCIVNLALVNIKRRQEDVAEGIFTVNFFIPVCGFVISAAFLISQTLNLILN